MPHFLKRLELNGFKSFAGRIALEFPAGIVAIVGPNGSGKSNVVDAIRWLLGERDAKNLRGSKVEDLIFAGTPKRPRVGIATASLHFENKNKFFPVDFEEVTVSRQVSRSGDSKYFLNQSEVLLRDLVDFLAKARLGSRGMVVIGQGDSDLFIRSSPVERREMIEEILGLREYQIKKSDAERRLKNSRINLEKTRALIEEILPHLRSLKRQTARWEWRGSLEEELRTLENAWFGSQLAELDRRMRAADESAASGREQYEALRGALAVAETRQTEIESGQPDEKRELAEIKERARGLIEKRGELARALGRIEAQIELAGKQTAARLPGGASDRDSERDAERMAEFIGKIKTELLEALDEDPRELHAVVENIIEEISFLLDDRAGGRKSGGAKQTATRRGENMVEAPDDRAPMVPAGLAAELEKLNAGLKDIERELGQLAERERSLESDQEDFYRSFKQAVAAVQEAKERVAAWEGRNREQMLEKDRLAMRREEVLRQIEQAGRRSEDFAAGAAAEPVRQPAPAELVDVERRMFRLRGELASIGEVDQALVKEASDTETRYTFLTNELQDLEKAVADLTVLMRDLAQKIHAEFEGSLRRINEEFNKFFGLMFGGGSARLTVERPKARPAAAAGAADGDSGAEAAPDRGVSGGEDGSVADDAPEGGVDIDIKLARKRVTSLDALSGGERSLVGIAALFAMVSVSPPPFLVLDEIDAPLDERNARRFGDMLKEFSKHTQFVVVTHNRATMEAAEILYGVTLDEDGSSKVISLKLER